MKICAIADLHGYLDFTVPECDLLLIAGDICPDRLPGGPWARHDGRVQQRWFMDVHVPWVQRLAPTVLETWGNHDWMPGPSLASQPILRGLIKVDELVEVAGLKIWFTPWSNQFMDWAWMKEPEELVEVYDRIPEGTDIIVSHQPPYGYGDAVDERYLLPTDKGERHKGSKELLATIDRVKPKLVVCGHIHSGHGRYQHKGTAIYNVSLVNEAYERVYQPTVVVL